MHCLIIKRVIESQMSLLLSSQKSLLHIHVWEEKFPSANLIFVIRVGSGCKLTESRQVNRRNVYFVCGGAFR